MKFGGKVYDPEYLNADRPHADIRGQNVFITVAKVVFGEMYR